MWTELEQLSTVPVCRMLAASTRPPLHIWDFLGDRPLLRT